MNKPPLVPATGCPTLVGSPLTSETIRSSPSGSLSLPVMTLPETIPSSEAVLLSSTASGAGLVTVRSNVSVTVPPSPSSAVTVIV